MVRFPECPVRAVRLPERFRGGCSFGGGAPGFTQSRHALPRVHGGTPAKTAPLWRLGPAESTPQGVVPAKAGTQERGGVKGGTFLFSARLPAAGLKCRILSDLSCRMEHNMNASAPEAPADESASPLPNGPGESGIESDPPCFEPPPLLSDCLDEVLTETLADTFPPGARKPRHDGWTPEAVAGFLRTLADCGIVDHAARAVGMSVTSAYAFRNRRQGRAFARMWDAVLVHRARARLASELQGRAIAGCVSLRRRDGFVVGEYHYYDNRLAMALLTRLDRLAERETESEAHLRTLSEDLDDYIDCIEGGGDADAFVEARKPVEAEPAPEPAPRPDNDPELTTLAILAGCPDYLDVDPRKIEVRDLDPTTGNWSADQWVRAYRSGFMFWLETLSTGEAGFPRRPGAPLNYFFEREAAVAATAAGADQERSEIDTSDLDTATIWDWTEDQLIRGWTSGLIQDLPPEFWDELAAREAQDAEEE
jgi:hypothetical protein